MKVTAEINQTEDGRMVNCFFVIVATDERQYKIIINPAEDSFDVVAHYPTGDRIILWSLNTDTGATTLYPDRDPRLVICEGCWTIYNSSQVSMAPDGGAYCPGCYAEDESQ